jgi:UPF0755 protein
MIKFNSVKEHPVATIIIGVIVAIVIACVALSGWYAVQLRPVGSSQQTELFVVKKGSTLSQIATELEESKLIRNASAFETYVKLKSIGGDFQAGTYALSPSQSVDSIATTLTKGKVTSVLVTILPGKRIDQIRAELINSGFTPEDVDSALDPDQYSNLPVMALKPSNVMTLEGLLWPDSFQKDQTTKASDIIKQSLVAMGERLTPAVQEQLKARGLTPYQGLVLASIVEQEVSKPSDQTQVAQVFYSRLKQGMTLGSDVTATYGAVSAGLKPTLDYDSPYNTRMHPGLPPTPISTINEGSLNAVISPAKTSWLYFVAGDNGTTYFSKTLKEHEAYTAKYCQELCSL